MLTCIVAGTRCSIEHVKHGMATVHALTAWKYGGWDKPAERTVPVCGLRDIRLDGKLLGKVAPAAIGIHAPIIAQESVAA